jgi:superfamily I DNA and/or RNA helicase
MLSRQYRMHPTIATLISGAFYDGRLESGTCFVDGTPKPGVVHPFTGRPELAGRSIVWLDIPWAKHQPRFEELGPRNGFPRYTSPAEVDAIRLFIEQLSDAYRPVKPNADPLTLALLSPYSQQVNLLAGRLRRTQLPYFLKPKPVIRRRRAGSAPADRLAWTVDSFQGNEADIVVVSLVRNNTLYGDNRALGFLDEESRVNVLLSRAERMLVLVGSWEFFCGQVEHISLDDHYHTLWPWKKAITLLDAWFASGQAVRLDAVALGVHP